MQQLIISLMRDAELFAVSPAGKGAVKKKRIQTVHKNLGGKKSQRGRILRGKWDFLKGCSKENTQILLRVG